MGQAFYDINVMRAAVVWKLLIQSLIEIRNLLLLVSTVAWISAIIPTHCGGDASLAFLADDNVCCWQ